MNMFIEKSISQIVSLVLGGDLSINEVYSKCTELAKKYEKYKVWANYSESLVKSEYSLLVNNYENRKKEELTLFAIPVGVKDIVNTTEYPTQMGSVIWKGFEPGNDARIVYEIKRHGGIVFGKTVTAEFAVHALNETLNPLDTTRTPGTSSSGSAVGVALGIVPVAIATQTAGSIIRPSSYCGVFGYVPSFGLVPRTGVLKTTDSLDTIGFITSRIDNIRQFLSVISVKGPDYPFVYKAFSDETRQKRGNRKWKVCFVKTYVWKNAQDYVKKAIEELVGRLSNDEEIDLVEHNVDDVIGGAHEVHSIIYDKSLSYYFENEHHDSKNISNIMNSMIEHGQTISSENFTAALDRQECMCKQMDDYLSRYDAIISISTSSVAPKRDEKEKDDPSLIWTLLHLPAVNIPAFNEKETKLPFGVQLVGRRYNDGILIEFAEYLARKGLVPSKIKDISELIL